MKHLAGQVLSPTSVIEQALQHVLVNSEHKTGLQHQEAVLQGSFESQAKFGVTWSKIRAKMELSLWQKLGHASQQVQIRHIFPDPLSFSRHDILMFRVHHETRCGV